MKSKISEFLSGSGLSEYQVVIELTDPSHDFGRQLNALFAEFLKVREKLSGAWPVFVRLFLSDAANQENAVRSKFSPLLPATALSYIEQPPLSQTKLALWAYFMQRVNASASSDGLIEVKCSNYTLLLGSSQTSPEGDSEEQTELLLTNYSQKLKSRDLSLYDACLRTWFFVNNIDDNYQGMVNGRNRVFDLEGLTPSTHFIASTGIGGRSGEPKSMVVMDTLSVKGIAENQVRQLYAADHLNRTSEYDVRFERGTLFETEHWKHIFISGTASIDHKGNVLFPNSAKEQTGRMLENVEALLEEGGCTLSDAGTFLVYLRDMADYTAVKEIFDTRFPHTPTLVVHAPVCRPQWLVEMECIAVKSK